MGREGAQAPPVPCVTHQTTPQSGLSQLCIPQSCGRSPRLTCGRRWPRSARTGCAGCSERTGTAGWRHRWSRLAGVPQTHLHGRGGAQSIPRAPLSPGQGWNPILYLARRGDAPGCCWGSHPGSPPRSLRAHSYPGEGREGSLLLHWGPAEVQGRSQAHNRATHKPHAIEGHLVVEVLHHVVPPLVSLWVGEVGEGCGARPDLQEGEHRAEPPAPPSTTAPKTFLSHSWGAAPTAPLESRGLWGCSPHSPSQSGAALWRFG